MEGWIAQEEQKNLVALQPMVRKLCIELLQNRIRWAKEDTTHYQ